MLRQGTTTFECKSGYGLTTDDEARCVALAAEVTAEVTYLGAHVVPAEFAADPAGYVDLVCGPMLAACAPHCRWVDVFCERGAFGEDEARAVLTAGMARGLLPRIHASQLGPGPGIRLAVELGAASADHCTFLTDADVAALASSGTVATLLPGAEFSTRQPYPDARRLLDAGATVALATDCNPGTSYTTSMPFCVALAVRDMRMTTEEAVWSATAGGARALRRTDVGYLAPGARADLIILDAPSHAHLAYRPGVPLTHAVYQSGTRAVGHAARPRAYSTGIAAAEADQRVAGLGHVGHVLDRGDHQEVVAGRDAAGDRALQGGQAAGRDERPRQRAPHVRHGVQDQPRARPALRRELAGQHLLRRRQQRDREPLRGERRDGSAPRPGRSPRSATRPRAAGPATPE